MSLPPSFMDELRGRASLGQVAGRRVVWDLKKSNQAKGDLWAPCPFHQERTASFHVDDRKGFYYCFGCQAKGDVISFVRETEGLGFMEAVEVLAREAGMEMPARDPAAKARSDRRAELSEVVEQAVRHLRMGLATKAGTAARAYLARREVSPETQERFELGYAPPDRQGLLAHLRGKGVPEDMIVEAGLCARPDGGGAPYDRFRDRIVFPIRDERGRAVSLGGRAMSDEARAKYLNGPETPLFDKGRTLYNLRAAREAAGRGAALIVAEGYMDVIALSQAGLEAAVAPLGTAVTEAQLRLMWRVAPEPIVALDGDRAGLRAAGRLVDLALPLLEPGQTLRFALLPEGQDPDDLIRAGGREAVERVLEGALPLSAMLWRRETEGAARDTPERRAALDRALREAVRRIADPSVRRHYADEMARLRQGLFGPPAAAPRERRGPWMPRPPAGALNSTRASALVAQDDAQTALREGVILATLLLHPALFEEFEEAVEAIEWSEASRPAARAVLRHGADRAACEAETGEAIAALLARGRALPVPALRHPGDPEAARALLRSDLDKLAAAQALGREIEEAAADLEALTGEGAEELTWRLAQAAAAMSRAERVPGEDRAAAETADNGLSLDRAERARARTVFDGIDFGRGGRPPRRRPA